jgi:predicted HAD superfamily Cof-like phosphohydrolase
MLEAFRDVATFELACDHLLTDGPPAIPDPETVYLRNELHTEEFDLLCEAMADGDMPRIANRIADLVWVLLGTAVRFGIDLPDVWYEVKKANMAKFGPGLHRREDGKLLEPPGWTPPDIEGILLCQDALAVRYHDLSAFNDAITPAEACSIYSLDD